MADEHAFDPDVPVPLPDGAPTTHPVDPTQDPSLLKSMDLGLEEDPDSYNAIMREILLKTPDLQKSAAFKIRPSSLPVSGDSLPFRFDSIDEEGVIWLAQE